jgi:hypothetical protein
MRYLSVRYYRLVTYRRVILDCLFMVEHYALLPYAHQMPLLGIIAKRRPIYTNCIGTCFQHFRKAAITRLLFCPLILYLYND